MDNFIDKSFKNVCSYCGGLRLFVVIGKARNYDDRKISYVTECQRCGKQYFVSKEDLAELLDERT